MAGGLSPIGFGAPAPQGFGATAAVAAVGDLTVSLTNPGKGWVDANGATIKPIGKFPYPLRPTTLQTVNLGDVGFAAPMLSFAVNGNGKIVAVGNQSIYVSSGNFSIWTRVSPPNPFGSYQFTGVIWDGSYFVAVGRSQDLNNGIVIFSSTGDEGSWQNVNTSTLGQAIISCPLTGIMYAAGKYVIWGSGSNGAASYGYDRIFTSNNFAIGFPGAPYQGQDNSDLSGGCYAFGRFYIGSNGAVLISGDSTASNFTKFLNGAGTTFPVPFKDTLVLGRTFGSLRYTKNGQDFSIYDYSEHIALSKTDEFLSGMLVYNDAIYAFGTNSVMWSRNGRDWYHLGPIRSGQSFNYRSSGFVALSNTILICPQSPSLVYGFASADSFVLPSIAPIYIGNQQYMRGYIKTSDG